MICLDDTRVRIQLVTIFQTIYTWTRGQPRASDDFLPDYSMTLGLHELTGNECLFAKTALLARVYHRASAVLKELASTFGSLLSAPSKRQSRVHGTA